MQVLITFPTGPQQQGHIDFGRDLRRLLVGWETGRRINDGDLFGFLVRTFSLSESTALTSVIFLTRLKVNQYLHSMEVPTKIWANFFVEKNSSFLPSYLLFSWFHLTSTVQCQPKIQEFNGSPLQNLSDQDCQLSVCKQTNKLCLVFPFPLSTLRHLEKVLKWK